MELIFPSAYFPNVEYFYRLLHCQKIQVSIADVFEKQTYRNRCVILNANGLQKLTVPVIRSSDEFKTMGETRISYAEDWQKNHLRSIESAYRRTPYYEYYCDGIEEILMTNYECLIDLNMSLTGYLVDKTGLSCAIAKDTLYRLPNQEELKLIDPKLPSQFNTKTYLQTFSDRFGFQNNLSMLDLLFNEGPNSISVIQSSKNI